MRIRPRGALPSPEQAALAPAGWPLRIGVATIVLLALLLRVAGLHHGLPFVYNIDERAHFVPRAIGMFGGNLNPQDFLNASGLTYLFLAVFWVVFAGAGHATHHFDTDPSSVFLAARITVALIATAGVWLVYASGARLLGRAGGALAAGVAAVAFLPVFYAHQALNDAPSAALVALALFAATRVATQGARRDYALAGVAVGLAFGVKYNALIAALPVLAAIAVRLLAEPPQRRRTLLLSALALAFAIAAFLITNPYFLLDHSAWMAGFEKQQRLNELPGTLLGERQRNGWLYYLWTMGWGLGYVPAIAAGIGALVLLRRKLWAALLLVPAPLVLILFEGSYTRYYGRYELPMYPMLCVLAAAGAIAACELVPARLARMRIAVLVVAAVALCGQGLLYSLHSDVVLRRTNTLTAARAWMVRNIPVGSVIVLEPIAPVEWQNDGGLPHGMPRWKRWARPTAVRLALGRLYPPAGQQQTFQNYELTLVPQLVGAMEHTGACWYVAGSTQSGRAFLQPARAPYARAFYRELERHATLVHQESPFSAATRTAPAFQFDWSFDWYPLSYHRPGPWVRIYHLNFGRCARAA